MKYKGEFWLSGEEDKTFLGEVKLGKRRSELSLLIPTSNEPDRGRFLHSDPLRPVLGVTTCGKRITLTNYFQTFFPYSFFQPRCAKFFVNEAFIGLPHEISKCDPEVETASITSKTLAEWCDTSSIEHDPDHMWSVKYAQPESKGVYKDKDYTVAFGFGARMESRRTSASIADNPRIEIDAERPLAWSRLFATLCSIMDVVSIGCSGYCRISHAHAASRNPLYIADHHFHSLFPDSKVPPFPRWLFTLRDLPDSAFTKWMEKAGELQRARALFFSAKYHKMFTETRVLLLTQAVEAYYRRVYKDEPNLERHLKRLCSEYADPVSVVFSDWKPRVSEIVRFRGQQTHSPIEMPSAAMESEDRLSIEHFLCLLLEICFMAQLDISTPRITQLIERSNYYSQLREVYGAT